MQCTEIGRNKEADNMTLQGRFWHLWRTTESYFRFVTYLFWKRQILQTEWSISPQVFNNLCGLRWRPMLELFTTSINAKLLLYICPILDGRAEGVEALSMNWKGLDLYTYPPTSYLSTQESLWGAKQDASDSPCMPLSNLVPRFTGVSACNMHQFSFCRL